MKTYTKHGFLYLELATQQGKPSVIIVSDKDTVIKKFNSEDARSDYISELQENLKKIGSEIYNIPSSAVWYNPNTVLSIDSLENKYLILEFPWNVWKKVGFTSLSSLQKAYSTVLQQLSYAGDPGDLSSYLLKSEAAETYLKIEDASKIFTNVALSGSQNSGDENFPYLNTFNISGIDSSYLPTVVLSKEQAESGIWDSYADTVNGAITIKTNQILEQGTIIPAVICQKV